MGAWLSSAAPWDGSAAKGAGGTRVPARSVRVSQGTCRGCRVVNEVAAGLHHIFHLCRIGYAHLEVAFIEKGLGVGKDLLLSQCQVGIYGTALGSESLGIPPGPREHGYTVALCSQFRMSFP